MLAEGTLRAKLLVPRLGPRVRLSNLTGSVHVADISVHRAPEICSQHLRFLYAPLPEVLAGTTQNTYKVCLCGAPARNRT